MSVLIDKDDSNSDMVVLQLTGYMVIHKDYLVAAKYDKDHNIYVDDGIKFANVQEVKDFVDSGGFIRVETTLLRGQYDDLELDYEIESLGEDLVKFAESGE